MQDIIESQLQGLATDELASELSERSVKIRVSPNSYFVALFLATFFSGFLFYLDYDLSAGILFVCCWILIPYFILNDKITFDGVKLARTGIIPRIWGRLNGNSISLPLDEIEQVETQALRAVKRGGSVFYRYRTSIRGNELQYVIASGGEDYRLMVQKFFPFLSENVLDNRSIELRDYLRESKETLTKAAFAKIPSTEFLESSGWASARGELRMRLVDREVGHEDIEKANYLRQIANELRLSGHLIQALETFRRALIINPRSGWILYEFARCLHSFAGAERDPKLERKALAALRLAEKRAENDQELLLRLGESYFQYGEWKRASKVFTSSIDRAGESFRSIRGLAEIALREGKIAHVIHHFATANRLAETPALRRWTQGETDYFTRLNNDDDYMDMELSRVNFLDSTERGKKTALKFAIFGIPWIIFGLLLNESLIVNVGWGVSSVALLIWAGMIISGKILSARVPLDNDE